MALLLELEYNSVILTYWNIDNVYVDYPRKEVTVHLGGYLNEDHRKHKSPRPLYRLDYLFHLDQFENDPTRSQIYELIKQYNSAEETKPHFILAEDV